MESVFFSKFSLNDTKNPSTCFQYSHLSLFVIQNSVRSYVELVWQNASFCLISSGTVGRWRGAFNAYFVLLFSLFCLLGLKKGVILTLENATFFLIKCPYVLNGFRMDIYGPQRTKG